MTAAENMALDDTLLESKGRGESPNTIHFLQFSPRAVLLGYHQSVDEEVRAEFCKSNGIHINRRITGGGAIFFDESQLGWEVICTKEFFGMTIPNDALFRALCEPVIAALASFGLKAEFRPRNDIEIRGRKISGTGGADSDGAFLFQGTMLTDFDVDTMLRSLKIPVEKLKAKEIDSVKERVTCLKWELGYTPRLESLKRALAQGFERGLKISLEPAGLTDLEKEFYEEKLKYYRSDEWINQVKPRIAKKEVVQAAYKADGGLVRVTLVVNLPQRRIKEIYITGDFLSFPPRALYDMEARLRGAALDREPIHKIIKEFFAEGRITVPGMGCREFLKPLDLALEKIGIAEFGIPLEYCNQISVTNGSFASIIRKNPSVLLLPYCSKLTSCELRYKKGCTLCGECSVGSAWAMGRDNGMKTLCVTGFEDLWQELVEMKKAGAPAFIGCCCQPFFVKHVDDFERAGMPGILLDINSATCYDLDEAKEAYAGRFERQTHLNLDLLDAILKVSVA
jgi:lipoate-protein ligase A